MAHRNCYENTTGCGIQVGSKQLNPEGHTPKEARHRAVFRFASPEIAASAVRHLHGQYLLNCAVTMRLIHSS